MLYRKDQGTTLGVVLLVIAIALAAACVSGARSADSALRLTPYPTATQSTTEASALGQKAMAFAGAGGGGGDSLDGLGGAGAYAESIGDLFTGEMPVLGPIVGSLAVPVPGGSEQVNIIGDFDPFTVMYQVVSDGRIIVTNRDLTQGLERPDEVWSSETWVDPETQESWDVYAGRLLASFSPAATEAYLRSVFSQLGLTVEFSWFEPLQGGAGNDSAWFHISFEGDLQDMLDALENTSCADVVEPYFTDIVAAQYNPPNDDYYVSGQCKHLDALRVVPNNRVLLPPPYSEQVVAVLDKGILSSHPDLAGSVTNVSVFAWGNEYQVYNNHRFPPAISDHGTSVAGIVSAASNNEIGVASCSPRVKSMSVRIADARDPYGDRFDMGATIISVRALREAFPQHTYGPLLWRQGVRVANMSFGSEHRSRDLPIWLSMEKQILVDLGQNDRLYVGGAGNVPQVSPNTRVYPAAFNCVLGVTGVIPNQTLTEWHICYPDGSGSNYKNDNYATYPISAIFGFYDASILYSTGYAYYNGLYTPTYRRFGGTSACAPQISALPALLYTARPSTRWWEVRQQIINYHRVYNPNDPGFNPHEPIAYLADFQRALTNW